jgi:hypothetical protein
MKILYFENTRRDKLNNILYANISFQKNLICKYLFLDISKKNNDQSSLYE